MSEFSVNPEDQQNLSGYQEVLSTVRNCETVSPEMNNNWTIEELRKKIEKAVLEAGEECKAANNGVIFTTLSGGLDSTLSLSILRQHFPDTRIVTFTMGGKESHPDIQFARLAARKYKTEHHEFFPDKDDVQDYLSDFQKERPREDIREAVRFGNFDVFMLYKKIASETTVRAIIVHDGIDEQMGGYWGHRKDQTRAEREKEFSDFWKVLEDNHLAPLLKAATAANIKLYFPYLDSDLVEYISHIPIEERASDSIGKKPLREVARELEVPEEIIVREKMGQIDMGTILDQKYR